MAWLLQTLGRLCAQAAVKDDLPRSPQDKHIQVPEPDDSLKQEQTEHGAISYTESPMHIVTTSGASYAHPNWEHNTEHTEHTLAAWGHSSSDAWASTGMCAESLEMIFMNGPSENDDTVSMSIRYKGLAMESIASSQNRHNQSATRDIDDGFTGTFSLEPSTARVCVPSCTMPSSVTGSRSDPLPSAIRPAVLSSPSMPTIRSHGIITFPAASPAQVVETGTFCTQPQTSTSSGSGHATPSYPLASQLPPHHPTLQLQSLPISTMHDAPQSPPRSPTSMQPQTPPLQSSQHKAVFLPSAPVPLHKYPSHDLTLPEDSNVRPVTSPLPVRTGRARIAKPSRSTSGLSACCAQTAFATGDGMHRSGVQTHIGHVVSLPASPKHGTAAGGMDGYHPSQPFLNDTPNSLFTRSSTFTVGARNATPHTDFHESLRCKSFLHVPQLRSPTRPSMEFPESPNSAHSSPLLTPFNQQPNMKLLIMKNEYKSGLRFYSSPPGSEVGLSRGHSPVTSPRPHRSSSLWSEINGPASAELQNMSELECLALMTMPKAQEQDQLMSHMMAAGSLLRQHM